jgi:hypothetical protein
MNTDRKETVTEMIERKNRETAAVRRRDFAVKSTLAQKHLTLVSDLRLMIESWTAAVKAGMIVPPGLRMRLADVKRDLEINERALEREKK